MRINLTGLLIRCIANYLLGGILVIAAFALLAILNGLLTHIGALLGL